MKNTAGSELTATLRRYFSVGTTTRRYRDHQDLHASMVDAAIIAATMPGYYTDNTQSALRVGFAAALAYQKHVKGYRIAGELAFRINEISAWKFAGLLGQMVDAGVTNNGEGERFFSEMRYA